MADEIIPDQESCKPTPTIGVELCGNAGCLACEDGRCVSSVGECYGYMKVLGRGIDEK